MKTQDTKFGHHIATMVGITVGLIVLAAPAAGDTFKFEGQFADVSFFSTNPLDPCIFTEVFVFASDDAVISHDPPGGPPNSSSESGAFVSILQFNSCDDGTLVDIFCGFAPLEDPDFQHSGRKLESATLKTTLSCDDFVNNDVVDVSVDLTWMAVDDPIRSRSSFRFRSPGVFFKSQSSGTSRSAEASGIVSVGTTNFTPNATSSAVIGNAKGGDLEIIK